MAAKDVHLVWSGRSDLRREDLLARLTAKIVSDSLSDISPAPQLGFDPIHRLGVARRSLFAVAELRQPFDNSPVALDIEAADDPIYHAVLSGHCHPTQNASRHWARTLLLDATAACRR